MKDNLCSKRLRVRGRFVREKLSHRFWRSVDVVGLNECWEWRGSKHRKGYGEIGMGGNKKAKAHRIAWLLCMGEEPGDMLVCHHCDNPPCCNPSHLFLGTQKTNKRDSINKSRHAYGERNGTAKLTEAQVRQIRELDKTKRSRMSLARQFGISGRSITGICRKETWTHVL